MRGSGCILSSFSRVLDLNSLVTSQAEMPLASRRHHFSFRTLTSLCSPSWFSFEVLLSGIRLEKEEIIRCIVLNWMGM